MTQKIVHTRNAVCLVGGEDAFGTASTRMRPLFLRGDVMPMAEAGYEMLAREDQSPYQHDNQAPLVGLQAPGKVSLPFDCKRIADRLVAAATPPAVGDADALSHQVLLDHAFGTSHVDAGTLVDAATPATTTALTVTTGQAARFVPGQLLIPFVAGAPHPRVVDAVAGDVVTVWPALPGAPAAGQLVLNTYSFGRAEAHSSSLTVEHAHTEGGSVETQRRGRGVTGQIAWTGEVRKLAQWAFEGEHQAFDEGDLSVAVEDVADDMGAAVLWNPVVYLFDNTVGTNPTAVETSKTMVTVPNKFTTVVAGNAVQGASAKVMTGGRESPVTLDVVVKFDAAYVAAHAAGTRYACLMYSSVGSGTAQRFVAWYFPNLAFSKSPTRENDGGLVYSHLSFVALANEGVAGSPLGASSTDLARSPVVFALG